MLSLPDIKRGDTFSIGCFSSDGGVPTDLSNVTIRSQIRSAATKKLVQALDITLLDQTTNTGKFSIVADTSEWPIGTVLMDIEIRDGSVTVSTETLQLRVVQDITHD